MEQKTEASQAVDARAEQVSRLLTVGGMMSNVMFNLAQRDNPDAKQFKELCAKWDAAAHAALDLRAALKAQPAPTEAQSGKLMELFKHTLGSLALHDQAEAERIGKLYRDAQPSGNTGELAQGEDCARLDADMLALLIREAGILNERGMAWLLNGESISLNLTNLLAIANMIEDRASAETGGVKS